MSFTLRACAPDVVQSMCEKYHGYGGAGKVFVYCFAVYEGSTSVAAYAWKPPPPGAAKSVCPEEPQAVLALSRMVAVPKSERSLKHVSKPLMLQMKRYIDRGRYPVLVTYSDEGQGHTGYVYKCSGWTPTTRSESITYESQNGVRTSKYSAGRVVSSNLTRTGHTFIQRWEQWACPRGGVVEWMKGHGWVREPVHGKFWRSGAQAFTFTNVNQTECK